MTAAELALLERLREPRFEPVGTIRELHPPDGGDAIDTYEGWQRRGYQVMKGATAMIERKCTGVRFGPIFGWHSVRPKHSVAQGASRPLKPGEDDLEF